MPTVGKYMYINGYEVLITAPNEGLLYLPLVKSRVPVIWQGLSIKTGPAGEDYGCVMAGEVAMQGSQTGAIANDLYRQVMALLTQGPGSFSGKFGEAVKLISAQGDSLKNGLPINWALSKGALDAGKIGYTLWQQKATSFFEKDGGTIPSEVEAILAQMQTQQNDLTRLSSCVVQNIPTSGGGDAASLRLKTVFFACELTEGEVDKMVGQDAKFEELNAQLATPINCIINGTVSLLIDYVAGWGTLCIEEEKVVDFFDFEAVKSKLSYPQMVTDAAGECIKSFIPFISKSKVADAFASGIIGAVSGLADNIMEQYDTNDKKYDDISDAIGNIDFSLALQKSGTNAVTNVIANVLGNKLSDIINKKVAEKGVYYIKGLLVKAGLSDDVAENIIKKLGYNLLRPKPRVAAGLTPTPHLDGNDLTCVRDQSLYEIVVNGNTWKFGLADNTNWNQTNNMPQRLWDQIRRLRRDQSTWIVDWKIPETYNNALRKDMRRLEDWFVDKYRSVNNGAFPPDNQNHQYLRE